MRHKFVLVMIVVFALICGALGVLNVYLPQYHVGVLLIANMLMLGLSLVAYLLVSRQVDKRAHAFVQGVTGASFIKLMVSMIGMLAYVLINRSNIHKPTVFVLFGIYAVYSATESVLLSKLVRKNKGS